MCGQRQVGIWAEPVSERARPPPDGASLCRPLIKLSIVWRRNGAPVSGGLSDFNRRLTVFGPAVGDAGFYECEAILRSSSVPSVSAGAFLHVYGGFSERRFGSVPASTERQVVSPAVG